jgi:hypothetical protein
VVGSLLADDRLDPQDGGALGILAGVVRQLTYPQIESTPCDLLEELLRLAIACPLSR